MTNATVTLERVNGSVVCTYWQKETASGLVCELSKRQIENIMNIDYRYIDKYLEWVYWNS